MSGFKTLSEWRMSTPTTAFRIRVELLLHIWNHLPQMQQVLLGRGEWSPLKSPPLQLTIADRVARERCARP